MRSGHTIHQQVIYDVLTIMEHLLDIPIQFSCSCIEIEMTELIKWIQLQNFPDATGSMPNGKTYPLFANNWITSVKLSLQFLKRKEKSWSKKLKGIKRGGGVVNDQTKNKKLKKKYFLVILLCVINRPSKLNLLLFPFDKGKCAPLITT
jgi:hypothetical protein